MDYAMVSKLEKARYYATERDRFQFDNFQVTVKGNNHSHVVTYDHGKWKTVSCRDKDECGPRKKYIKEFFGSVFSP